ncbi:hypothetical protein J4731_22090 [Providencia rettgeri]|nr:hypothetical protein [Providencia rettgeri]
MVSRLQSLNEIQEAFTARMIGATLDAIITIFLLLAMGFYSYTMYDDRIYCIDLCFD